ncbi:hypothetical protein ACEPPN_013121 [Leptodophora sp. 'Broadleaf-Isolate-01']
MRLDVESGYWYLPASESGYWCQPASFYNRSEFFRGSYEKPRIVSVIRSLLAAGACTTKYTSYKFTAESEDEDEDEDYYENNVIFSSSFSSLDLAVYTQSTDIVEMLLHSGATVRERSLKVAIDIRDLNMFDYLLTTEVPISEETLHNVSQVKDRGYRITYPKWEPEWMETLLSRRQDIHIKRAAMIEAIRFGNTSMMDDLLKSEEVGSGSILVGSPKLATAIEECCTHGHIAVIRRMLDTNFRYRSTIVLWLGSSLHAALSKNNLEMANHLVEAVGDVNVMTPSYQTALLVAISRSDKPLIGKLLKAGAKLNAKGNCCFDHTSHQEFSGAALVSAITYAPDYAVVKSLIEAGADVNAPGSTGFVNEQGCWCRCITPLTAAARRGDWECIKILIRLGAAVNNPPGIQLSCTPLAAAASRRQSIPLVQFLLGEGANPEDAQALEAATEDAELLEFLLLVLKCRTQLRNNSNLGRLAIDKAIQRQDKTTVKAILDSKLVDLNSVQDGADPSGIVLECDDDRYFVRSALLVTIHNGSQPKLELLLEAGAAPDMMVGGMEHSPLQLAVHKQCQTMVHILLEHGADAGATSPYGESGTPIQLAAGNKNLEIVKLLLDCNANPNTFSPEASIGTPIQLAAENKNMEMVKLLLGRGANPNIFSPKAKTGAPIQLAAENKDMEMVRLLLEYRADPNAVAGSRPHTALQIAARDGCKELVDILLENGADTNSLPAENSGATALQFAAIRGFLGIAYLLLQNNADVNAAASAIKGRTALEGAAEHGRIDMAQLLLNAGASVHGAGQVQYERALSLASKNGHYATRQMLESYHG